MVGILRGNNVLAEEQKKQYLLYCSSCDREILLGKREMTREDLCRISLRAEEMGLTVFEDELLLHYPELLREIGKSMMC